MKEQQSNVFRLKAKNHWFTIPFWSCEKDHELNRQYVTAKIAQLLDEHSMWWIAYRIYPSLDFQTPGYDAFLIDTTLSEMVMLKLKLV